MGYSKYILAILFVCQTAYGDWTAEFPELDGIKHTRAKREVASIDEIYIHRLEVNTRVVARFSDTKVESEIENNVKYSREIIFQTQLPNAAFISNFSMIINGKEYVGVVKEKAVAQAEFEEAKNRGVSAGLVQTQQRETQWFKVSVNVESSQSVIFKLRYQQLLERKLGKYQQVIFADPGLTNVGKFLVKISITEPTGISTLDAQTPYMGPSNDDPQDKDFQLIVRRSRTQASVKYYKTNFNPPRESGRRFVVTYDVDHPHLAGNVWRHNGYFVHFFAPTLDSLPKRVVFVVDVSGSMSGRKIEQTKSALRTIIPQMKPLDLYNIVTFQSRISEWKSTLQPANDYAESESLRFIQNLRASGGTDFNSGVITAIRMLDDLALGDQIAGTTSIIILTDGRPTVGERNLEKIKANIRKENKNKYSLFTLGFGEDLDHQFLKEIAYENNAVTRRIFEGADASNQLRGFFSEVANPILKDVSVTYNGRVDKMTNRIFPVYYGGGEIVIMGKYGRGSKFSATINAIGKDGKFSKSIPSTSLVDEYPIPYEVSEDFGIFFERMWVYLTVTQLIKREIVERNQNMANFLKNSIISKSLKYNFVTPFTAMIAKKPRGQDDDMTSITDKKPAEQKRRPSSSGQPSQPQRFFSSVSGGPQSFSGGPSALAFGGGGGGGGGAPSKGMSIPMNGGGWTHMTDGDDDFDWLEAATTTTTTATTKTTTTAAPTQSTKLNYIPSNPNQIQAQLCSHNRLSSSKISVYSEGYDTNYRCKWSIRNPMQGKNLLLTFDMLDMEEDGDCRYDRVIVYYNDDNGMGWKHRVFCGYKNFDRYSVRARKDMVIVFQSNMDVAGAGFKASVNLI